MRKTRRDTIGTGQRPGSGRWAVRLAVLAALLQALLPFTVLAAPAHDGPPLMICTVEGMKVIPGGGDQGHPPGGADCPFCVLPGAGFLPPPAPPVPLPAIAPGTEATAPVAGARPQASFFLVGRPTRAPPWES